MANGVTITARLPYIDSMSYGPYAENNWHFSYNPLVTLTPDLAADYGRSALIEFYQSVGSHLACSLDETIEFSWVDWEDADNISIPMDPSTFTGSTTNALPNEVALCLTFKCDPYGGHRRQSFYNRVYLGPLAVTTNASLVSNAPGRPTQTFRDDILEAYQLLQDDLDIIGVDGARHAVYSTTHDSSGLVTSVWVDDAWDTVRRREVDATVKDFWVPA